VIIPSKRDDDGTPAKPRRPGRPLDGDRCFAAVLTLGSSGAAISSHDQHREVDADGRYRASSHRVSQSVYVDASWRASRRRPAPAPSDAEHAVCHGKPCATASRRPPAPRSPLSQPAFGAGPPVFALSVIAPSEPPFRTSTPCCARGARRRDPIYAKPRYGNLPADVSERARPRLAGCGRRPRPGRAPKARYPTCGRVNTGGSVAGRTRAPFDEALLPDGPDSVDSTPSAGGAITIVTGHRPERGTARSAIHRRLRVPVPETRIPACSHAAVRQGGHVRPSEEIASQAPTTSAVAVGPD